MCIKYITYNTFWNKLASKKIYSIIYSQKLVKDDSIIIIKEWHGFGKSLEKSNDNGII